MQELVRWLNGWVYIVFGADGLLVFSAHPLLYALVVLAALLLATAALAWWISRRVREAVASVRLSIALAWSADGRRCLALARQIRRGGARLRHAVRGGIEDRAERRALLRTLHRFTRSELGAVLQHAQRLIRAGDDRREAALRLTLERQTERWSAAGDEPQRERIQEDIARTRQALATVGAANTARDAHLRGLSEAAEAVAALERELSALRIARSQALPEFRDRINGAARRIGHLQQAYRELDAP